ncbi:MAG: SRPBCC family protein [Stenotrophobium sp.]
MKRIAVLALLLCTQAAAAAQVLDVQVDRDGDRYHIDLKAHLDVPAARAYSVFSDYRNLPAINPAVRSATVLGADDDGVTRLATEVHLCVAFFCHDLKQVQDMRRIHDGDATGLSAQVLPQLSDLRYGRAEWRMRPCDGGTCLHFSAELEPGFWVPPLLGPWLIERKLRAQAITTSEGIERLAAQAP